MKNEDEFVDSEDNLEIEEDLLEFKFDELLEGDMSGGKVEVSSDSDEEIIDLVDVVEEGVALEDLDAEGVALSFDEEALEGGLVEEGPDFETAGDLSDLESEGPHLEIALDDSELEDLVDSELEMEPDLETEMSVDVDVLAQEFSEDFRTEEVDQMVDSQMETGDIQARMAEEVDDLTREFSAAELGIKPEKSEEAVAVQVPEKGFEPAVDALKAEKEIVAAPEPERPAEMPAVQEAPKTSTHDLKTEEIVISELRAKTELVPPVADAASIGISEERLEAIIRKVVEEVVERVARQTMTDVAERVIGEAIDALKQSLESPVQ